jgi:hypothetical protein
MRDMKSKPEMVGANMCSKGGGWPDAGGQDQGVSAQLGAL